MNTTETVFNTIVEQVTGTASPVPEEFKAVADQKRSKGARAAKPVKMKRESSAPREGSKLEKAIAFFKQFNGERKLVIDALQSEVGMSQAGATTYFYNAKKGAV